MMYGDGWMWHNWGGWFFMTVGMVALWAAVITAIVLAVRYLSGGDRRARATGAPRSPEDVLADRYARGEIDDEEFRRRTTLLREHGSPR